MSDLGSDDEDILLFPITDLDSPVEASQSEAYGQGSGGSDADEESNDARPRPRPQMPLRERRIKRAYSLAKPIANQMKPLIVSQSPGHKMMWMNAINKAKKARDPWANFHIESLEAERCTRHRYNALKKSWVSDEVLVKMEPKPFTNGAMRQCYRLSVVGALAFPQPS